MIKKLFSTAVFILLFSSFTIAQSKDEKAVAAVVERLRAAMLDGNRTELENLTMGQLSYGHSSGHIDNKAEFVEKLATGASDFVTIDLSAQTISISDKTALVRHKLDAKTNDGGKPGEAHLFVLLVWQKKHGHWRLLARQAVKVV
jgi:hypothetical protein